MTNKEKDSLYEEFQRKFPLSHLREMTIDEYVLGSECEDSFCAWLEYKTKELGAISGGTSLVHGIYKFKKTPQFRHGQNKDEAYAWYSKYGTTHDQAFNNIRTKIVQIAEISQNGDFERLDDINFSPSAKMKIAFMYSNKKIINIFSAVALNRLCEEAGIDEFLPIGAKAHRLMDLKGNMDYWDYTAAKWSEWIAISEKESFKPHYFVGSVGQIGEGYDDENLDRCIKYSAHIMHKDTKQKGEFGSVKPNSVIFLKYNDTLVAYGSVISSSKKDDPEGNGWSYRIKVEEWFFYDMKDSRRGVSKGGISNHIIKGSQWATIKEVTEQFAMDKMREIDPTSPLYKNLKCKASMDKYKKLLKNKKNIILQGAPGVGKTYSTSSIAVAMCNEYFADFGEHEKVMEEYRELQNNHRIEFCTFHQSMDYEDFVEGLKPRVVTDHENKPLGIEYKIIPGVFKRICENARADQEHNYVLIIDEINRGNISKIFGELITLLEPDKRMGEPNGIPVNLLYSKDCHFTVPSNLYIIGTMNTTDRSTGTIDYALRRRFAFVTIHADSGLIECDKAKKLFDEINDFLAVNKIEDFDIEDLKIGHSYFLGNDTEILKMNLEYGVIPLIREYISDGIIRCQRKEANEMFTQWLEVYDK